MIENKLLLALSLTVATSLAACGGGETMHDNLALIKESYPDMKLMFTEGTNEGLDKIVINIGPMQSVTVIR